MESHRKFITNHLLTTDLSEHESYGEEGNVMYNKSRSILFHKVSNRSIEQRVICLKNHPCYKMMVCVPRLVYKPICIQEPLSWINLNTTNHLGRGF